MSSSKKEPLPVAKAPTKGRHISEDDDFGEQTYARALKAVTETIKEVHKQVTPPKPSSPKAKKPR